jgi:hypothetical protein
MFYASAHDMRPAAHLLAAFYAGRRFRTIGPLRDGSGWNFIARIKICRFLYI